MSKFQLLPPLSSEEYERLEISIKSEGLRIPIEVDENDDILDGHHRYEICQKHNIPLKKIKVDNLQNDLEKMAYVLKINSARRQMSGEQEKEVDKTRRNLAKQLYETGQYTQEQIARLIGMSQQWVSWTLNGSNTKQDSVSITNVGNAYTKRKRVSQKIGKDEKQAILKLLDSGETQEKVAAEFKVSRPRVTQIKRAAEKKRVKEGTISQQMSDIELPQTGDWCKLGPHLLYCGDTSKPDFWQNIPQAAFAFADPPYNAGVDEWDKNFKWQHDWLIEKAPIVCVTPGIESIQSFFKNDTNMPYVWSMSCWIKNGMTRGKIGFGNWIYIAVFATESIYRQAQDQINVTINTSENNTSYHKRRKPFELMVKLIELFTQPGDIVIDPFLGSGTTLFAAEKTGRICVGGEINPEDCKNIEATYGKNKIST